MKSAIIPAQIITVEDKIAGNLTLSQLVLLTIPLFFALTVYALFPTAMTISLYKIIVTSIVFLISIPLSLRIKERIVFQWIVILIRYNKRPTFHIFDKNDSYQRSIVIPLSKSRSSHDQYIVKNSNYS